MHLKHHLSELDDESALLLRDARAPSLNPAATHASVDIAERRRRELKTEVFDTYALLSALVTGFCVCTFSIEHNRKATFLKHEPLRYWALTIHQYLVQVSTALSLFSTFVFMLATMYTRTALTRSDYPCEIWDTFTAKTAASRHAGFWCMYIACFLYMMAIPCGLFYYLDTYQAILGSVVMVGILGLMMWHAKCIHDAAEEIFASSDEMEGKYGDGA